MSEERTNCLEPSSSVLVTLTYNEDEGWSDGYKSYPALASPIAELFRFRRVKPGMKIQISTPNDKVTHRMKGAKNERSCPAPAGSRFLWEAIEAAQQRKGDQAFDAGQRVNAMLCDHHVYECVRWDRVAELLREVGGILSEHTDASR